MRKLRLLLPVFCLFGLMSFSQTSVDFTLTDCDSTSQHLYSILDQGKIVILIYEHQCSSCTAGTKNVSDILKNHFASEQDIVVLYLDNGGKTCLSTKSWISTNNFVNGPALLYSSDGASPYGSGMPIIVITAGTQHKIFMKTLSLAAADTNTILNALNNAKGEISGITEFNSNQLFVDVFPNPVSANFLKINITSQIKAELQLEILNTYGEIVSRYSYLEISNGNTNKEIDISTLKNGIYLVRVFTLSGIAVKRIIICQ
jgi:hypothetical protein